MKKKRINYFKYFSLFFAIAVLVFIAGCSGASPTAPIINSFSADPPSITVGESSTLSWSVTDATSVTIDNGIGSVALTGTSSVNPTTSTTYTLTATNSAGSVTATCAVTVNPAPVAVGDSYGGGIVAYIFVDGDPDYVPGETHGLIAATADQSTSIIWAIEAYQNTEVGGTLLTIGSGSANTDKIIAQNGVGITYAAGLARAHDGGGYTDWFLPSKDELNKLDINKVAIGGFAEDYYWSSSDYDAGFAWYQDFYDGSQGNGNKDNTDRVRAVWAF